MNLPIIFSSCAFAHSFIWDTHRIFKCRAPRRLSWLHRNVDLRGAESKHQDDWADDSGVWKHRFPPSQIVRLTADLRVEYTQRTCRAELGTFHARVGLSTC